MSYNHVCAPPNKTLVHTGDRDATDRSEGGRILYDTCYTPRASRRRDYATRERFRSFRKGEMLKQASRPDNSNFKTHKLKRLAHLRARVDAGGAGRDGEQPARRPEANLGNAAEGVGERHDGRFDKR